MDACPRRRRVGFPFCEMRGEGARRDSRTREDSETRDATEMGKPCPRLTRGLRLSGAGGALFEKLLVSLPQLGI